MKVRDIVEVGKDLELEDVLDFIESEAESYLEEINELSKEHQKEENKTVSNCLKYLGTQLAQERHREAKK